MSLRAMLKINIRLLHESELRGLALAEDMWERAGKPTKVGPVIAIIEEVLECALEEGVIYPRVLLLRKKELQRGSFELNLRENPMGKGKQARSGECPLCRDTGVITNATGRSATLCPNDCYLKMKSRSKV